MLSVVCWKWIPLPGYRSRFTSAHVNTLARMVKRNYPHPHKFYCVTDDPVGLAVEVSAVKLWNDHSKVSNPWGSHNPSCYRRLKLFSKDAGEVFGDRLVSLDLDVVITGDMSPLWNREDDFVIWGDTAKSTPYNGSMFLLKTGSRAKVWESFHPLHSPQISRKLGYVGSDQAWIGASLGSKEKIWTIEDGVYSYRNHILTTVSPKLPDNARIVIFHGKHDPWNADCMRRPWIQENYR